MSTDPFRRLIEQWRLRAAQNGAIYASGIDECADELEAALAPLSGPVDGFSTMTAAGIAPGATFNSEPLPPSPPVADSPEVQNLLVEVYQLAKDNWCAQCYGFTGAPEHVKRGAHEAAREGFDAICKKLGPVVHPIFRAEWKAAELAAAASISSQEPQRKQQREQALAYIKSEAARTQEKGRLGELWAAVAVEAERFHVEQTLHESVAATKPLRESELKAEDIPPGFMDMRLKSALPPSSPVADSPTKFDELLGDLRRLEAIYNRDQIAQPLANEIESIFDQWLYD